MLSIIIPAFDEAARIGRTLDALIAHFPSAEIIVADDGSQDETADIARARGARVARLPENRGKGAAVRAGVLAATGDPLAFCDADGATSPNELSKVLAALARAELAIGSRALDEDLILTRQTKLRENMGKTFNVIARALLPLGSIKDTQCGLKAFRAGAARAIFSRQRLDGFAFDVEVILLARELGYTIAEVPVEWHHVERSKVSLVGSSLGMLAELVRLRLRR